MNRYEPKTDCFAFNKNNGRCNALNELYCRVSDKCNFYKTKENFCNRCKKSNHGPCAACQQVLRGEKIK